MQPITEANKELIESFYNFEFLEEKYGSVDKFIEALNNNYEHDYGTICHAVAAAAVYAAWKMNSGKQGGITGFQGSAVMWEFITHWDTSYQNKPLRLVDYSMMCYPQYFYKFEKTISEDTWKAIQEFAKRSLEENREAHTKVIEHWKSIIAGVVPFGYSIKED